MERSTDKPIIEDKNSGQSSVRLNFSVTIIPFLKDFVKLYSGLEMADWTNQNTNAPNRNSKTGFSGCNSKTGTILPKRK